MDIVQLIEADHRQIDRLFDQFERAARAEDAGQQARLARQLVRALSVHASAEEQVLYPALARVGMNPERLDSLEDHHAVKVALAELQAMRPAHDRYAAKVHVVAKSVRRHVEEEETAILPQLRQSVEADELQRLGDEFRTLSRSAPTRPHPAAPDQPPANVLANAAASLIDRLRDALLEAADLVRATAQQVFERALRAGRDVADRARQDGEQLLGEARARSERAVQQARVLGAEVVEGTAERGAALAERIEARVAPASREIGRRARGAMARAHRVPREAARKAGRAKGKPRIARRGRRR
jgi:hemerythrin superfamily protein